MRVESQTLVANQRTPFRIPGRFFLLIAAGSAIDIEFRRNKSLLREKATNVEAGYKSFPGDWSDPDDNRFDEFVLTSASAQSITFGVSESAGDYARVISVVDIVQPSTLTDTADIAVGTGAATLVRAADATHRSVIFKNIGAGAVRIGSASVTATRGHQLGIGESIVFTATGNIRAVAESIASTLTKTIEVA